MLQFFHFARRNEVSRRSALSALKVCSRRVSSKKMRTTDIRLVVLEGMIFVVEIRLGVG